MMHIGHTLLNRTEDRQKGKKKSKDMCTKMKSSNFDCFFLCSSLNVNKSNKQANAIVYRSKTQAKVLCCDVNYDK